MKRVLALALCFCFVLLGRVFAEVQLQKHTREVGMETYYHRYKEPYVMQETGIMYGVNGAYTFYDKLMLRAEGRFAAGQVDYKNSGTMGNVNDFLFETRGLAGYGFSVDTSINTNALLIPYVGIGYRYLNDDSKNRTTSTGAVGYERESNYVYSPIGIETITEIDSGWFLDLSLEYDYFWKGIQKSHLSDANRSYADLENDQNKGFGLRSSAKLIRKSENLDFVIEPFLRYWSIKKSEEKDVTFSGVIVGYGYEPKNHTVEAGIKLGLNF